MSNRRRVLRLGLLSLLLGGVIGLSAVAVLYWMIAPNLPSVDALRDVRMQVPLSVRSQDGKLIAQFGETRRYPVAVEHVPLRVKQAFIATEDAHFYDHPGVDWRGVARAVWLLATTDDRRVPGGSTITQQLARMFFLSPEYSYTRKLIEMGLALKIERELSKDEILGLYLNKSFFGNRAYGVAAAAEFYYGKTLDELSLEEAAMLATIPKFPSTGNPIVNPGRAMVRRNYVLDRMSEVGFISVEQAEAAKQRPDRAHPNEPPIELEAPWVAEMARQEAIRRFGDQAMIDGYQIWTTLDSRAQEAANRATRDGLIDYDRRHGWRGAEGHHDLPAQADEPGRWRELLRPYRPVAGLLPALVVETSDDGALLGLADGQTVVLPFERMGWARRYIDENRRGPTPGRPSDVVVRGDVVRIARGDEGEWQLAQIPEAQAAIVALDSETGAIRALTGGFSFALSEFNRATRAQRPPGSGFKPFVYAAAFERGFTPASITLDAPVVFNDTGSGRSWRPSNSDETFSGPIRLREALIRSRNLVSIRLIDAIGVPYVRRYAQNFGFALESLPEGPSLALGTGASPPLTMARAYATFANGGFLVDPYFMERIEDRDGNLLFEAEPAVACAACAERLAGQATGGGVDEFDLGSPSTERVVETADDRTAARLLAPRAIDERVAYLMASLLRDVVSRGTASVAGRELQRRDIGGKSGTHNDGRDGWFSGFGGRLAATAWMGMDDFAPLGAREYGSTTGLPIWIEFMRTALRDQPERMPQRPEGIATAMIDPDSGELVGAGAPGAISEIFRIEDLRRMEQAAAPDNDGLPFDIF